MVASNIKNKDYLRDVINRTRQSSKSELYEKEKPKMTNMFNKNLIDRMFKQVDNVVWDLMTGKVGFKNSDGIVTIDLNLDSKSPTDVVVDEAPDAQVNINMLEDFGLPVPAFAQSTPVDAITLGDMIYTGGKVYGWVVKKSPTGKSFKIIKPDGTKSDWSRPKTNMIGFDTGVMVLRSLLNMLPGGASGLGTMQSAIMPMMMMSNMMGDNDTDSIMSKMIPMLLMSQIGGNGMATEAAGGMNNMMQMMLLMQMMKSSKSSKSGNASNGFWDN